jgi:N-carbamoylputrescine amidase
MTPERLHVALVQHADQGSRDANLALIEQEIATAASAGARLILLQELHNSAYFCQVENPELCDLAEAIPGPTTQQLAAVAREHGTVIVASLFERRAAGLYHNTAAVIESTGELAGIYRKMHIPDDPGFYEKFYFTPGDLGFTPIETSVGKLGVLVCWDQWYPEAARLMALAGADLLLYPTAIGWDPRDDAEEQARQREAWLTIQRAHAIANGIPVLSCNRSGLEASPVASEAGIRFWGSSFVCGPQGEWLARAGDTPETLHAEIELGRCETTRRIWPFLRDRRIDAYGALTKRFCD